MCIQVWMFSHPRATDLQWVSGVSSLATAICPLIPHKMGWVMEAGDSLCICLQWLPPAHPSLWSAQLAFHTSTTRADCSPRSPPSHPDLSHLQPFTQLLPLPNCLPCSSHQHPLARHHLLLEAFLSYPYRGRFCFHVSIAL